MNEIIPYRPLNDHPDYLDLELMAMEISRETPKINSYKRTGVFSVNPFQSDK